MRKILIAVVALVVVAVCGKQSDAQWVNVSGNCPNGLCPLSQNVQPQVVYSQPVLTTTYSAPASNVVVSASSPAPAVEYSYSQSSSQPSAIYSAPQQTYQSQGVSNQYSANQNSGRTWFRGMRWRR